MHVHVAFRRPQPASSQGRRNKMNKGYYGEMRRDGKIDSTLVLVEEPHGTPIEVAKESMRRKPPRSTIVRAESFRDSTKKAIASIFSLLPSPPTSPHSLACESIRTHARTHAYAYALHPIDEPIREERERGGGEERRKRGRKGKRERKGERK